MRRPCLLLLVFDIEGLLAFLWTFFTHSETGQGIFLWLSTERLVLASFALLLWAVFIGMTIAVCRSSAESSVLLERLDKFCRDDMRLGQVLIPMVVFPLLIAVGALVVLRTPLVFTAYERLAPNTFPLLHSVVSALLPILALFVFVILESGLYLAVRYRSTFKDARCWSWERSIPALILTVIIAATLFHWVVLGFQLRFFVNNRAWYWKIEPLPFGINDLFYVLTAIILFGLVYGLFIRRGRILLGLALLFMLGWFLQAGVGLMAGRGFASLGERYFSTYHKAYVLKASQSHESVLETIQRYEKLYGSHAFTSTKPPGLMAFYVGLDHLVNGFPSAFDEELRYQRLSSVVLYGFPLIAMCVVGLLYLFARQHLHDNSGLVARVSTFLYVLAPGMVLFSLFPDQAIYPLVFLLGLWLIIMVIQRQSLSWAFLLGVLLYAAVFFAFSMLPLYPFTGLYLLFKDWPDRSSLSWKRRLGMALAIGAGTVVLYLLLLASVQYDFLPRFQKTMAINHNFDFYLRVGKHPPATPESFMTRVGQIAAAGWINNLDFAAGIGFPVYFLFLVQALRRSVSFFKGKTGSGDIILMSLLCSFLVLNLAGTAQGEVPRLWLFWLPLMVIFAAYELEPIVKRRPWVLFGLSLAQLITIMLTFHFQDLRM